MNLKELLILKSVFLKIDVAHSVLILKRVILKVSSLQCFSRKRRCRFWATLIKNQTLKWKEIMQIEEAKFLQLQVHLFHSQAHRSKDHLVLIWEITLSNRNHFAIYRLSQTRILQIRLCAVQKSRYNDFLVHLMLRKRNKNLQQGSVQSKRAVPCFLRLAVNRSKIELEWFFPKMHPQNSTILENWWVE